MVFNEGVLHDQHPVSDSRNRLRKPGAEAVTAGQRGEADGVRLLRLTTKKLQQQKHLKGRLCTQF